jgi:O-antigen ligase
MFMVCPVAPERWADMYSFYGTALVAAFIVLTFFGYRHKKPGLAVWLMGLYALWVLVSRILNSDLYMTHEPQLVLAKLLCSAVFASVYLADSDSRAKLIKAYAVAVGIFYFAAGLLAIILNLLDTYCYIPPEGVLFGLDLPWHIHYINVFNTNRTISALWFYIALSMMVYLFFACKKKLWRIPIVIAGVLFYVAIAMAFSRTVKMITSVSAAMLLILLAYKYLPLKKLWQKAAVLLLCAALMIPLTFKSFEWTTGLMSQVSSLMISETTTGELSTGEGVDLSDNRSLTEDMSNLSERSQIYASFIPSLKVRPLTILIGNFSDKLMNIPNMFVDFPVPFTHMHNFLLEVFMLTGLPGFLLVVAFCLILVVNMVKLFFNEDKRVSLAAKVLTIPVTGILLYGMFEIVIFTECGDQRAPTDMRELSFFILAAAVLAYCNDRKCK